MMTAIQALESAGPEGWTITRCAHGCVHLHLGRCSVTLSGEELVALRDLLVRATLELEAGAPRRTQTAAH